MHMLYIYVYVYLLTVAVDPVHEGWHKLIHISENVQLRLYYCSKWQTDMTLDILTHFHDMGKPACSTQ